MKKNKLFEHGGNVYQFAKENNISVNEVIDFSSNINFVKPDIQIDLDEINLVSYPDPDYTILSQKIYEYFDYDDNIGLELFNGASAAIFSLIRYINPKKMTLYAPIYLEYKRIAENFSIDYTLVNRLEMDTIEVEKESLIVFVNPSTPDGKYYDLKPFLEEWIKKDCTILIDESFIEFTDKKSVVNYIQNYPKLYILKSMTKFFSHAGIRIGYLLSNVNNINQIKLMEAPWKISSFDSYYLLKILTDKNFINKSQKINNDCKSRLYNILNKSKIINCIYESTANYYLTETAYINGYKLQELLGHWNILIRVCDNFDFLNKQHVRFAVKDLKSLSVLEQALNDLEGKI